MARDLQDSLCLPWKRQISRRTALLHRQRKIVNMMASCEMSRAFLDEWMMVDENVGLRIHADVHVS
jgi:hypothetical protein